MFKLQLFICVHVCKGWGWELMPRCTCGSQRAPVGVWESVCSFCHAGSGHQTQLIKLGAKHLCPLSHLSSTHLLGFYLQSVFVCILVPYGHIAPQAKKTPPSPCAPAFATSAHSSLSWSLGSWFFSAVSLGRQPAAAPSEGGREEWSELVLVVELSEGWKLLCSGEARGRTPKS